jgi:hypothetical protein
MTSRKSSLRPNPYSAISGSGFRARPSVPIEFGEQLDSFAANSRPFSSIRSERRDRNPVWRCSLSRSPPAAQSLSTMRREPGILMHVHPVSPRTLKLQQPQLPRSKPDGQPAESSNLARAEAVGRFFTLSKMIFVSCSTCWAISRKCIALSRQSPNSKAR